MSETEIQALEMELYEKTLRLHELKKQLPSRVVPDYSFSSLNGDVSLRELFAGKETLLAIHNMGQGCRYCTLWGDGINGFLPHMEAHVAVVMLSKDDPETQQRFANSRQWRFRMASHGGGVYAEEQSAQPPHTNMPGAVCYHLKNGEIHRGHAAVFGPGDLYCSVWNIMALAGLSSEDWTPQYNYWKRPARLDDGGDNILD